MESQPNTTPAVSRAHKWRHHTAVQAARMLNAAAFTGDRDGRSARTDEPSSGARSSESRPVPPQTPWGGRPAMPAQ